MSAAPAAKAEAAPPAKAGKKKLIIIIAAALVLVLGGGGAAVMLLKKKPAEGDEEMADGHARPKAEAHAEAKAKPRHDPKHPPVFLSLDPFTVNLADRESERFAQIGVTLEIDEAKTGEDLKVYMPAVRNNILMVLSHRTAAQLVTREGKEKLARSIQYAALRPLGFDIDDEDEDEDEQAADMPKKKKKKKKLPPSNLPVTAVHFSNFIVQ